MRATRAVFALTAIAALIGLLSTGVGAQVVPDSTEITLDPGETADPITKTVTIPPVPAQAEICFVVDISGSFSDDIRTLNANAPDIAALAGPGSGVTLGLTTFADYPIGRFGSFGDEPYMVVSQLTTGPEWQTAVASLSATSGGDGPESQLDAIVGAAVGLTVDGTMRPSCGWSGVGGVNKFIIGTTDFACHEPGVGKPHQFSTADAIATLTAESITFLGLETPGAGSCFAAVAAGTGGVTEDLASDGSNITEAVRSALSAVDFTVEPTPVGCDGLTITFDPPSIPNLEAGDTVTFTETITLDGDTSVSCVVQFGPAGEQVLNVTAASAPSPSPSPTASPAPGRPPVTPVPTATPVPVVVAPIPTPVPESLTIDKQVVGFPSSHPFSFLISPEVEGCSLPQRLEISGSGGQIGASVIVASATTGANCTYSVVEDPKANYEPEVAAYGGVAPDGFVRFINHWTGGAATPAPTDEVRGVVISSEPLAHTGSDTDIATIGFYLLALGTSVVGASRIKRRRN